MFKLAIPQQSKKGDIAFFRNGIRFSHEFIERERLTLAKYVWVFLDEPYIGFLFLAEQKVNSLKLTDSGKNTSGKTVSAAFLKKHEWIEKVMLAKDISRRKFTAEKVNDRTEITALYIKYKVNLTENMPESDDYDIPF